MTKRKRRHFTPEFKAKVVLEALSGESSQGELCPSASPQPLYYSACLNVIAGFSEG